MPIRALTTMLAIATAMPTQAAAPASPAPVGQTPTFCERLAPQVGMRSKKDASGTYWQADAINGVKAFFVGGTGVLSLRLRPIGDASPDEDRRVDAMCDIVPKGHRCDIVGPVAVTTGVGDKVGKAEAAPGERAELRTVNTSLRCQDR